MNQNSETERKKHRKDFMILTQAMTFSKDSSRTENKGKHWEIKKDKEVTNIQGMKGQKNNNSISERVANNAGENTKNW